MMRIDEISKAAAYNKPIPKGATAPEMLLYSQLELLYADFKRGYISKEEAIDRKTRIVSKCEGYENAYSEWCSVWKYHQENIRLVGTLTSDIEKENDIIKAAFKSFEAIGRMTGDKNFLKRQERKFDNEKVLHRQEVQDR